MHAQVAQVGQACIGSDTTHAETEQSNNTRLRLTLSLCALMIALHAASCVLSQSLCRVLLTAGRGSGQLSVHTARPPAPGGTAAGPAAGGGRVRSSTRNRDFAAGQGGPMQSAPQAMPVDPGDDEGEHDGSALSCGVAAHAGQARPGSDLYTHFSRTQLQMRVSVPLYPLYPSPTYTLHVVCRVSAGPVFWLINGWRPERRQHRR